MNLDEYVNNYDNLLIITPNSSKKKLLIDNKSLLNVKYMTIEEYKNNYFFSYDYKTISYLMINYNYNLEVAQIILNNLYVIDIKKSYSSPKLNLLKNIKIELINKKLLYFNEMFLDYLMSKKIIVYNYDNLEKYEEEMFKDAVFIKKEQKTITTKVTKCKTLESEILYVVNEIIKLIKSGININNIYLSNVNNDDLYIMNQIFKYFNIPINIDMKESIYGTQIVTEYLKTKRLPSINNRVSKKLFSIINKLAILEDDPNYETFLIHELQNTYLPPTKYTNAVNIIDYRNYILNDNDYLFIIGFNQDIIPYTYKDEDYIPDILKDEVSLYKTVEKNIKEKSYVVNSLGNIKNLYLSYREKSSFNTYLPSVIIRDENLQIEEYNDNIIYDSNLYNKIILGEYLDNYYKYGEKNSNLDLLLSNYNTTYNTYDNKFTGINNSNYLDFINKTLKVSYTSLNTYNQCSFKYYLNYVLKINTNNNTFSLFIGNLFHHIFEIMYKDNFNFEVEWNSYLETRELSLGELLLLDKIKNNLYEAIEIIKNQEELTTYNNRLCEYEININLNKPIDTIFNGKIDKILYKNNINDTYFSVIDYKTGNVNTNLNNIKYGLDMQLAVYLYLINNSKLFDNPIFTGIYFQKVLFPNYKFEKNKDLKSIKTNNMKLQGYSTNCRERLYEFDKSYENSSFIKGIKINKDTNFSKSSKVINDLDVYNLLKYTENKISSTVDKIIEGNFSINPKIIDKDSSCSNCEFKDICFVNNSDLIYLEKSSDLDFLGGELNG